MEDKIEVFIAFDKEDVVLLRELKNHLRPLEIQGVITVWDASQIVGGTDWKQAINAHLETASIILLLVSADFMASPAYELAKQAVAKNAPPKVYVIPVLLHEVDWENSDFSTLTPLPSNRKPIGSWPNRDAAYVNVVKGIREIVAELKASETASPQTEKVTVDSDYLEYKTEDQPWYASNFPQTTEIDQEQAKGLSGEIDVVIITATDEELRAVMHHLEPYPRRKSALLAFVGPETYYLGKFGAYKAVITKCRMGSIGEGSVILATSQAQDVWHPKAIIMVGIAFGKDSDKQKIGDVLVASQIISYEQQRVGEQVIFRGAFPPSNTTLLNRFENAPSWRFVRPDGKLCDRHVGPILSGEKLVDDPEFKLDLFRQFPQAIGGEMEGAGLCAASGRFGVAWILVKSICDWGDGKKHKKHQPLAAAAAVSLVHHVLSQKTALISIKKPFNDFKNLDKNKPVRKVGGGRDNPKARRRFASAPFLEQAHAYIKEAKDVVKAAQTSLTASGFIRPVEYSNQFNCLSETKKSFEKFRDLIDKTPQLPAEITLGREPLRVKVNTTIGYIEDVKSCIEDFASPCQGIKQKFGILLDILDVLERHCKIENRHSTL